MAEHLGGAYTKMRPEDFQRIGGSGDYDECLTRFRMSINCTSTDINILRTATQQRKCLRDSSFLENMRCSFATCPPPDDDSEEGDVEIIDDDAGSATADKSDAADASNDEDLDDEGDAVDGITPGGPE